MLKISIKTIKEDDCILFPWTIKQFKQEGLCSVQYGRIYFMKGKKKYIFVDEYNIWWVRKFLKNLPIIVNIWHCDRISKIRCHLQRKARRWHRFCSKIISIVLSQFSWKDESHCSRLSPHIHRLLGMDRVLKSFCRFQCIISLSGAPTSAWTSSADGQQSAHSICGHNYQNFLCKSGPSVTSSPYAYLVLQSWTS